MSIIDNARKLRRIIEQAMQSVDGQAALDAVNLYPAWENLCEQSVTADKAGYKFTYAGNLYKTIQPEYTFVSHYVPGVGTESLFDRIDDTHTGTLDDPIPYDGNMTLENGKYYVQANVVYLCIRDTGNPVHHALAELIGLYVNIV